MQKINENSFIQVFSKPINPRLMKVQELKRPCPIEKPSQKSQENPKTTKTKNKSISFYGQKSSSDSLKLPSIYKNHMKYFLNEESLKKSNKRKYSLFKNINERNPSYILYS